jgi:hypothetical protein
MHAVMGLGLDAGYLSVDRALDQHRGSSLTGLPAHSCLIMERGTYNPTLACLRHRLGSPLPFSQSTAQEGDGKTPSLRSHHPVHRSRGPPPRADVHSTSHGIETLNQKIHPPAWAYLSSGIHMPIDRSNPSFSRSQSFHHTTPSSRSRPLSHNNRSIGSLLPAPSATWSSRPPPSPIPCARRTATSSRRRRRGSAPDRGRRRGGGRAGAAPRSSSTRRGSTSSGGAWPCSSAGTTATTPTESLFRVVHTDT